MPPGSPSIAGGAPAGERRPTLEELRAILDRALTCARKVETRAFEGRPVSELQDALVPATVAALELALETFSVTDGTKVVNYEFDFDGHVAIGNTTLFSGVARIASLYSSSLLS